MRLRLISTLLIVLLSASSVQALAGGPEIPLRLSISIPLGSSSSATANQVVGTGEMPSCEVSASSKKEKPTFWDELLGVAEASLMFSTLDFIYFNVFNKNEKALGHYRAFQGILQTSLSIWLFYRFGGPEQWREGLKVAGAFNLFWWTGNDDLIYYGIGEAFHKNNARGFASAGGFMNDSDPNGWAMRHFWWTPLGLGKMISGESKSNLRFTRPEIFTQAAIGFLGSVGLLAVDLWKDESVVRDIDKKIKSLSISSAQSNDQSCAGLRQNAVYVQNTMNKLFLPLSRAVFIDESESLYLK